MGRGWKQGPVIRTSIPVSIPLTLRNHRRVLKSLLQSKVEERTPGLCGGWSQGEKDTSKLEARKQRPERKLSPWS